MSKQYKKRILSYDDAINEALIQKMHQDPRVFVLGQGVKSPWYVGRTTADLYSTFGPKRVIDTPVSENAMTGAACGAALCGMRPIIIHPRMDFMVYAMDPIVNEAANWHYMFGGSSFMPVVIRAIINRRGEQGAQHSQALQAWFAHVPGLKVVMPATATTAKGLLIAAIEDDNPVLYIDDRDLYSQTGHVPQNLYSTPIGKARIVQPGTQCTIATFSAMLPLVQEAISLVKNSSIEIIDLQTVKPIDYPLLLQSVKKTGRMLITDTGWITGGISAEIAAHIAQNGFKYLKAGIVRIGLPNCPAPVSAPLEQAYYPSVSQIKKAIYSLIKK